MTVFNNQKQFNFIFIQGVSPELKHSLEKKYQIQAMDIEDVFTDTQLSKIEQREKYLYLSLHLPQLSKLSKSILIKEVHFFISSRYILVIDKNDLSNLKSFVNDHHQVMEDDTTSFSFFYEILDHLITAEFKTMTFLKNELNFIEQALFDFETSQDDLYNILTTKRNLITYASLISPLESLIIDLQTKYSKFIDNEGVEKLDDSLDKIKKLIHTLNNYKEFLTLLSETHETLINRATNEILKILTSISLLALVPTFIVGFFGMNVYFGWGESATFWPIIGVIILIIISTCSLFFFFKKRKWI